MKQKAFTLLELLIAIIIIGILSGLAAPGLSSLIEAHQRKIAVQDLASGIRSARVAAITRNQVVSIQAIDEDWSNGWRIIARQADSPLLVERALDGKVRIVGNRKLEQQLGFGPLGGLQGSANGTLHICLKDQPVSQYRVIVAITGQVRVADKPIDQPLCG